MGDKLLLDEYPLIILPQLATAIGLNEAIVLQQIHYWLKINELSAKETHFRDGRWWTYNSVAQWCDQFPFWSYETIKRTLISLRNPHPQKSKRSRRARRGPLLLTQNYNTAGFDKTIWYAIDYDELGKLTHSLGQNDPTSGSECSNGLGQNALMDRVILTQPIPETTTDHHADNSTDTAAGSQSDDRIVCSIHDAEMTRREKDGAIWYSHRLPGGEWCKGSNGDTRPKMGTTDDRRRAYVTDGVLS